MASNHSRINGHYVPIRKALLKILMEEGYSLREIAEKMQFTFGGIYRSIGFSGMEPTTPHEQALLELAHQYKDKLAELGVGYFTVPEMFDKLSIAPRRRRNSGPSEVELLRQRVAELEQALQARAA